MSDTRNEEFEDLKALARSIEPDDRVRHAPPPDLWERIRAEAMGDEQPSPQLNVAPELDAHTPATPADPDVIDLADQRANRTTVGTPDIDLGNSSRFSPRMLIAVAAALIAFVVVGSVAIAGLGGDPAPVYAAEISNADLPEAFDGTASVTVEVDDDPQIEISFDAPVPTNEPVELWLLSADGTDIVSVGLVEAGDTTWDWPEGLTPEDYPIVDLSIEPADGDPTHSGRSILRGELTAT